MQTHSGGSLGSAPVRTWGRWGRSQRGSRGYTVRRRARAGRGDRALRGAPGGQQYPGIQPLAWGEVRRHRAVSQRGHCGTGTGVACNAHYGSAALMHGNIWITRGLWITRQRCGRLVNKSNRTNSVFIRLAFVRLASSVPIFKSLLKTNVFSHAFNSIHVLLYILIYTVAFFNSFFLFLCYLCVYN